MPNAIYPDASQDAVAVFDGDFKQVFQDARPMSVRVRRRSHVLDHPLETGEIISDHRVLLPDEIDLMILAASDSYRDIYAEIARIYQNADVLIVQTRANTYSDMVISDMPHEERPELFDTLPVNLRLRSVRFVSPAENYSPKDATNADTKAIGEQAAGSPAIIQPDSGERFSPQTSEKNNFFNPPSSYFTPQQTIISGTQAKTIQTGVR